MAYLFRRRRSGFQATLVVRRPTTSSSDYFASSGFPHLADGRNRIIRMCIACIGKQFVLYAGRGGGGAVCDGLARELIKGRKRRRNIIFAWGEEGK